MANNIKYIKDLTEEEWNELAAMRTLIINDDIDVYDYDDLVYAKKQLEALQGALYEQVDLDKERAIYRKMAEDTNENAETRILIMIDLESNLQEPNEKRLTVLIGLFFELKTTAPDYRYGIREEINRYWQLDFMRHHRAYFEKMERGDK